MNDFGAKSLNIYCVVEDTDTHEESKIKIIIHVTTLLFIIQ